MYKNLKDFLAIIKRSNLRGDTIVKLPMRTALDIENELAILLLELKDNDTNGEKVFDGGKFKN
jgi:hypothetical protein